jgi:sugar/nucleoside kinase (ribokinase family)
LFDFDVLMIGNFAKDKLIVDGVEEIASGGGVYYGSVVVKRLGRKVVVVTRLHRDDFHRLEELRGEGITIYAQEATGTSGIANYYQSADMERRICKPIGFGGKYSLSDIPGLKTRLIYLSPLFAGEVDLPFLQALASRAPVALDIQGFIRVPVEDGLEFRPWEEMEVGLRSVTYLKVDLAEAEQLTGTKDLQTACKKLAAMGPQEVVLTQSSGVTVFAGGKFFQAPFMPRSLAGRTGRGDTCFSAYLAKRLTENPETACRWAGVVTTLKQENPGPWKGTSEVVELILGKAYS